MSAVAYGEAGDGHTEAGFGRMTLRELAVADYIHFERFVGFCGSFACFCICSDTIFPLYLLLLGEAFVKFLASNGGSACIALRFWLGCIRLIEP